MTNKCKHLKVEKMIDNVMKLTSHEFERDTYAALTYIIYKTKKKMKKRMKIY